jgi:hypothetical protein
MKIPLKHLKWFLPLLYLAVIGSLAGLFLRSAHNSRSAWWFILWCLGIVVLAQLVFVFGAGTANLCQPMHRRRLFVPVLVAALMLTVLVGALFLALTEVFHVHGRDWVAYTFWAIVCVNWVVWTVIFYVRCRPLERHRVLQSLATWLLAGSLLELLAAVPSHLVVMRRPGCLVGLNTGIAIMAGVCVMLWSFGPGIVLLFLRNRLERERIRRQPLPIPSDSPIRSDLP